ncbi:MAG: 1-acyl-sn-glycerol-3-phosphate acyltransferase [Candidatus Omnitrophica bacterium]|nr:1-acyl-sn-glycerol-3-phosphate acyltransferase [Candidatus Omnitrophota bacterium]
MKLCCSALLRIIRCLVKSIAIVICFLFYFFTVLCVSAAFIFLKPVAKRRLSARLIHLFNLCLIRIINIRIKTKSVSPRGPKLDKGMFIVSNHSSYVDGFVLGALFPIIYVSKSELKDWPLIGLMSDFSGTLYIDRNRKNHISEYIGTIADTLNGGVNVLFFPEGTSSDGESLLPFKTAFFEAPLAAGAPVVPVSIVYVSIDGEPVNKQNRDRIYWYGDMTFADHLVRLLSCSALDVEVGIHPVISPETEGDRGGLRKRVCELAYEAVQGGIWPHRA